MAPFCLFLSPRDACYEIGKITDSKIGRLIRRPWNQYEPDTTSWWLIPSPDWPAYRHGKYYFDWGGDNSILCGLYIEKGLHPRVASAYKSAKGSRYIMDPSWAWFNLLRDLKNHEIEETFKKAIRDLNLPVDVRVDAGYVHDPGSFDPYAPRFKWDIYLLRFDQNSTQFNLVGARKEGDLLNLLGDVRTFNELAQTMEEFDKNDWMWLDFFIAFRLYVAKAGVATGYEGKVWNPYEIWENFLKHFSSWLI
jgi:hypothetical protein